MNKCKRVRFRITSTTGSISYAFRVISGEPRWIRIDRNTLAAMTGDQPADRVYRNFEEFASEGVNRQYWSELKKGATQ